MSLFVITARVAHPLSMPGEPSQCYCDDVPAEEVPHQLGYLVTLLLKRGLPGVEQVELQILQVSLVRFSTGNGEDRIVLSPGDKGRRLVIAEICLPFRVERRIAAIAVKQGKLDFVVPRPVEQRLIDVPVVGMN